jgi:hypothetical protein
MAGLGTASLGLGLSTKKIPAILRSLSRDTRGHLPQLNREAGGGGDDLSSESEVLRSRDGHGGSALAQALQLSGIRIDTQPRSSQRACFTPPAKRDILAGDVLL